MRVSSYVERVRRERGHLGRERVAEGSGGTGRVGGAFYFLLGRGVHGW